jgi:hypothetical protein
MNNSDVASCTAGCRYLHLNMYPLIFSSHMCLLYVTKQSCWLLLRCNVTFSLMEVLLDEIHYLSVKRALICEFFASNNFCFKNCTGAVFVL